MHRLHAHSTPSLLLDPLQLPSVYATSRTTDPPSIHAFSATTTSSSPVKQEGASNANSVSLGSVEQAVTPKSTALVTSALQEHFLVNLTCPSVLHVRPAHTRPREAAGSVRSVPTGTDAPKAQRRLSVVDLELTPRWSSERPSASHALRVSTSLSPRASSAARRRAGTSQSTTRAPRAHALQAQRRTSPPPPQSASPASPAHTHHRRHERVASPARLATCAQNKARPSQRLVLTERSRQKAKTVSAKPVLQVLAVGPQAYDPDCVVY